MSKIEELQDKMINKQDEFNRSTLFTFNHIIKRLEEQQEELLEDRRIINWLTRRVQDYENDISFLRDCVDGE